MVCHRFDSCIGNMDIQSEIKEIRDILKPLVKNFTLGQEFIRPIIKKLDAIEQEFIHQEVLSILNKRDNDIEYSLELGVVKVWSDNLSYIIKLEQFIENKL